MAVVYTPERLAYCRQWYAENKERLKGLSHRKEAKKLSDKKYYEKNKDHLKSKAKQYVEENRAVVKERRRCYYLKHRDDLLAVRKIIRATPEYKTHMAGYRAKNRLKIRGQEKVTSKRWIRNQVDNITDSYIIGLLTNKEVGIFKTWDEAREYPELIEIHKQLLLTKRLLKDANTGNKQF